MKNVIRIFKPNLKLAKGSRLASALFIGVSMAMAAGIIWGANIYYDIDTSKIMIGDAHQATTTQVTVNTASTALTVAQSGSGAAFSATSTSAMTADMFKITNLGSGKSFVVEDADSDTSAFVVDALGNVGIASSTPSTQAALSVQGDMLGSGLINLYGTTGTSTFGAKIQMPGIKITGGTKVTGYVLTVTDTNGNAEWAAVPAGVWMENGGNIYQANIASNVAMSTTTARYDLDVWGNAAFGTTTNYNTPLLLVNSNTTRVGIGTSTPSDTLAVQGNIIGSGTFTGYGTGTSTFGGVIDVQGFRMVTGSPGVNKVLTTIDGSGTAVWTSVSGVGGITGTGTLNYLPIFTGAQTIGDSVIAQAGGNVGIGNAGPSSKLTVSGGNIVVSTNGTATTTISSGVSIFAGGFISQASSTIAATTTILNGLIVDGNTLYVMADNNRVGIATSSPSDTFSVNGNIIGSGNLVSYGTASSTFAAGVEVGGFKMASGASSGYVMISNASGVGSWQGVSGITPSNWSFVSVNAISPTSTIGIIVNASSTFAATTTITKGLIVDGNTLYVMSDLNRVGIATSTPGEALTVQGNIFGSGNIVLYGTATSSLSGDLSVQGLETAGNIWSANSITVTSQSGAITIQPFSNNNANVILGGTGLFTVGSTGQFKIDASGNVTTTGNIYASAFISTGDNAYTRKVGDEILRGAVPVFGFDLPVRCKTSCNAGTYATISRTIENNDDIFPMTFTGTTRKYRFTIRYADATSTAATRTVWQVATSSDATYVSQFTLPPTGGDLAKGFTTTTNFVTLPTTGNWFLRATTGGSGNYDLQVYEVLLMGIDQVDNN